MVPCGKADRKRMVVAYDHGPRALEALKIGLYVSANCKLALDIICVIHSQLFEGYNLSKHPGSLRRYINNDISLIRCRYLSVNIDTDIVHVIVKKGWPASTIVEHAFLRKACVVIIGRCNGFKKSKALGLTTKLVLRQSLTSVLVV